MAHITLVAAPAICLMPCVDSLYRAEQDTGFTVSNAIN